VKPAFSAVFAGLLLALWPLPARLQGSYNQEPACKPKPVWVGAMVDQGNHDPRLKGYSTPDGFKLDIVADFPTVANPVGMAFGPEGALHVLEWTEGKGDKTMQGSIELTYKDGSKRQIPIIKKSVKDRIKVLRDKNGQGIFDEAKLVLEEEFPSSFLFHDRYLYVAAQATVRRYKQPPASEPYGKPEVIVQGFGGAVHRQVSGLSIGNDGWLYIACGEGDHFVEGSDGSRVDVLRSGAIFRSKPNGSKLHLLAQGLSKPCGNVTFDKLFNVFHADCGNLNQPKTIDSRLLHVAEDADFGWRSRPGTSSCEPDRARTATEGQRAGKMAPLRTIHSGSAAGVLIYNETFLPPEYCGLLYCSDAANKSIRAYKFEPEGATFTITHEFELLTSNDAAFRPCQPVVGPDGALYVCDQRSDPGLNKLSDDGKHGRIYRLSWAGTKHKPAIPLRGLDAWSTIVKQTDAELLDTLGSENFSDRQQARHEIVDRGIKLRSQLLKMLEDEKKPTLARVAALGALQSMWNADVAQACRKLLGQTEPDLSRLSADALALNAPKGDKATHQDLVQALDDTYPAVQRALALAIGRIGADGAADTLVNLFKFDSGKDRYLTDGIVRGIERLGKPGIDALVNLANSGMDKDLQRTVTAFTMLRCPGGADTLPDLLKNVHLTSVQKVMLIESYNNYLFDPPISLDPVVRYLDDLVDVGKTMPMTAVLKVKIIASQPVKVACLHVLAAGKRGQAPNTQKLLRFMLENEIDRAVRLATIKALASEPTGARLVGEHFLAKKLPPDFAPHVVEVLRPHASRHMELAKLLAEVLKVSGPSQKEKKQ
jgi:putative membrane-bound dehydrogenase-like protein